MQKVCRSYGCGLFQMLDWVHRNKEIVKKFQEFLLNLLSAHNYYTKSALEKLMPIFKSGMFSLYAFMMHETMVMHCTSRLAYMDNCRQC
jgi:hypothetical protein